MSEHILIIAPAWVGDMVMAQSLLIQLKRQQPDCLIDVLAPEWVTPIATRMMEVRHALPLALGHGQLDLKQRYRWGKRLAPTGYQQVFVLPNSFKSALIPYWANIPQRIGFVGEFRYPLLNHTRRLNKKILTRTVDRFVSLAVAENAPLPDIPPPQLSVTKIQNQTTLQRFNLNTDRKCLVLCAGAEYGDAKQWSGEYFAQVANQKIAQGWQVWLLGSKNDSAINQKIHHLIKDKNACIDLVGKTSLLDACDLLASADCVISNDSGLMHVAAALNKPLIALYGSSDPHFTPPLSDKAQILSLNLACSPCFKRVCPLGHKNCLQQLLPEQVLAKIPQ